MLQVCADCTTRYAPAAQCPHCGSSAYYLEGETMAKSTVHGGASHEGDVPPADAPAAAEEVTEEVTPDEEPAEVAEPEEGPEEAAEGDAEGEPEATEPEGPARPVDSASKADWVAYAVARGLAQADAEGMTKAALIEALG